MVELSKAQDVEAGDGTTSVVVTAGALLGACKDLFGKGIHPNVISRGFKKASAKAMEILQEVAIPIELTNRDSLIQAASTSLNSKVPPLSLSASLQMRCDGGGRGWVCGRVVRELRDWFSAPESEREYALRAAELSCRPNRTCC